MSVFTEKMAALGYRPLRDYDQPEYDVGTALSGLVDVALPAAYLEFLREYPITGVFDVSVDCHAVMPSAVAKDSFYHLSGLFSYCSIDSENVVELRRSPLGAWDFGPEFLAIGDNTFGNFFCLKLTGDDAGAVYYWEHDHAEGEECMFLVAPTFTNFIERLQEEVETPHVTTPRPKGAGWFKAFSKLLGG